MRTLAKLGTLLAASLLCAHWTAPAARACSAGECTPSIYFPSSGTVPANLPGFYWWPSRPAWSDDGNPERGDGGTVEDLIELLRFARVDKAKPELLQVELVEPDEVGQPYLIRPKEPLVAGAKYVLWDATHCYAESISDTPPAVPPPPDSSDDEPVDDLFAPAPVARIETSAAADLPTALGALAAEDPVIGSISVPDDASCSTHVDVLYSAIVIAKTAATGPWADVLFYATEVDGKPFAPYGEYNQRYYRLHYAPGVSLAGPGRDHVYTGCGASPYSEGVAEGAHRARMSATIPGTEVTMRTNEVKFALTCPAPVDAGARDASVSASDGGVRGAADHGDASVPTGKDASVARLPASHAARSTESRDDGGCRIARAPTSDAWLLAPALGWLLRRRRA